MPIKTPTNEIELRKVIRFEYRDMELGYWIEVEIPLTKENWDWVLAHPNTAFIRKTTESKKPVVTFQAGK